LEALFKLIDLLLREAGEDTAASLLTRPLAAGALGGGWLGRLFFFRGLLLLPPLLLVVSLERNTLLSDEHMQ